MQFLALLLDQSVTWPEAFAMVGSLLVGALVLYILTRD